MMKTCHAKILCLLFLTFLSCNAFSQVKLSPYTEKESKGVINGIINNMVYVEGGTFTMGNGFDPQEHKVTVGNYFICKYEVTQREWQAIMGKLPYWCTVKEGSVNMRGDNKPVVGVSHDDCENFAKRLSRMTGKKFRLPTEAEWEYAARGGKLSKGYIYAGGNNINAVAWNGGNSGSSIHEVGKKQPNELGLYDMSGNAQEWCHDFFSSNYYLTSPSTNPQGPVSGDKHVLRGGFFSNNIDDDFFAVYYRVGGADEWDDIKKSLFDGFRLVCDPE